MDILTGSVPLDQLPPARPHAVRVFLCSAGDDTREERNYLMEHAYHKLTQYCRYKYGIEFLMIDLKWGVPEKVLERFYSDEFVRSEITRCREQSIGPDLVILLGHKYGEPSAPTSILADHFEMFLDLLTEAKSSSAEILDLCYFKDTNPVPPVYTRKSFETIKKACQAVGDWAPSLPDALTEATTLALSKGHLTEEEAQLYLLSDIGAQVQSGLVNRRVPDTKDRCLYVRRAISDVKDHLFALRVKRFVDLRKGEKKIDRQTQAKLHRLVNDVIPQSVGADNSVNIDVEWRITGGNVNTDDSSKTRRISRVIQKWNKGGTLNLFRHENYLDDFCKTFVNHTKSLVNRSFAKLPVEERHVITGALVQLQMAKRHVDSFCDVGETSETLAQLVRYVQSNERKPLILTGEQGSGKTCLAAKMISYLQEEHVVVARFLDTSPSRTLEEVLVSVNRQLSAVYGKPLVPTFGYNDTVKEFRQCIGLSQSGAPLCVVIDGLELLYEGSDVDLSWIQHRLPVDTKVIVTMATNSNISDSMSDDMFCHISVSGFSKESAIAVFNQRLKEEKRSLTAGQMRKVTSALGRNSSPIYTDVLLTVLKTVDSFDPIQGINFCTVEEAIAAFLQNLGKRYDESLVKHVVSYITAARYGVTEHELDALLSIDDELLTSLFDDWMPPVRRMPSLLWLRVLHDLRPFLVEIEVDQTALLTWRHRKIAKACAAYYLEDDSHRKYIHSVMGEYFMGIWGCGRRKPFTYTDQQIKLFDPSHSRNRSSADRIIQVQPYRYEASMDPQGNTHRCNFRKLSELPYHFLKSDNIDFLLDYILFDYRYLHNKIKACGVLSTMKEYLLLQAQPVLHGIMDLIALVATLRKIIGTIHMYPNTLNVELTGRLSHMITISPYIKSLIKQCDHKASAACPLIPTFTCYDTLQAGTVGTILYTKGSNTAREKGLSASSPDLASIVSKEDGGKEFTVWDPANCERKDAIRVKETGQETVFKELAVTPDGRHLVGLCQAPSFSFEVYSMEHGDCIASRREEETEELHSLRCLTNSFMAVETETSVMKVYSLFEPKEIDKLKGFESPICITPNEKYFIGLKAGCLHIAQLHAGNVLTHFEGADEAVRVAVSGNSRRLLVGLATGIILVYNLSSVHRHPLHPIAEYPPKDLKEEYKYIANGIETRQMGVTRLVYSRDGSKFLADYDGRFGRMSILWDYQDVNIISLLQGNILGTTSVFSNDDRWILRYTPDSSAKTVINIYRTDDGHLLLSCDMKDTIHNILVSSVNSLAAITISDTILVVNIQQLLAANKFKKIITLNPYQTVSNSFRFPKFLTDGNIVYSDDIIIPPFNYFDIQTNDMKSVDLVGFHTEYLNEFPQERMLTPDGKRLLYTFYSKSGPMPTQNDGKDEGEKTFMTSMTRTQGQRKVMERKDTRARLVNMQATSRAKGRQCVLRAFDITSGDLDYQINLEDERFLHVSSMHLITKKTLHSKTRGKTTFMINIYNLSTGAYEMSVMEDSNVVELMDDNTKLITLRGPDLTLVTIYNLQKSPPALLIRYNLKQSLGKISVKKMTTFPFNLSHILFTYTHPTIRGDERSYCLFDSQLVSIYQPISGVSGGFKDISQDGKFAIDKTLKIYDLETGVILKQVVPHIGKRKVDMEARLTSDNRYVIWYDASDQTLCVATNSSKTEVIAKCVVHKTSKQRNLNGKTVVHLSNCGRTIVVTDNDEFKVYSLRADKDPLQKMVMRPTTGFYRDSQVRAGFLLNRIMSVPIERSSPSQVFQKRESVIRPLYA